MWIPCVRCGTLRGEKSFFPSTGSKRDGICKPCLYRPDRACVARGVKALRKRPDRTQKAIRYVVKQTQTDEQPLVYLLKVHNFYKIGISKDVNKRIRQLSTGCSAMPELIAVAPGGRQLEQELHEEFKNYRKHGEWFGHRREIIARFVGLPGAMIFLPGHVSPNLPAPPDVSGKVETPTVP